MGSGIGGGFAGFSRTARVAFLARQLAALSEEIPERMPAFIGEHTADNRRVMIEQRIREGIDDTAACRYPRILTEHRAREARYMFV